MAERRDAELLQIVRAQGAQNGSVDVVGLERLDVALQAQIPEPRCNIQNRPRAVGLNRSLPQVPQVSRN